MEENTNATVGEQNPAAARIADGGVTAAKIAGGGRMYSEKEFQSEVDKRVTEGIKTAKSKWISEYEDRLKAEKDEAARLAEMSADERAKAELEAERAAFNNERSLYQRERLTFECTKQLADEKLPVEFAPMLTGKDAGETKANIEKFSKEWAGALEAAVAERLKGKTPKFAEGVRDGFIDMVRRGAGLN